MSTNASWQQAANFLTLVANKGTPLEQIQKLYSSGLLADLLDANIDQVNRDDFRRLLGLVVTSALYCRITLDYGFTLEQMIALGRYDWKNDDITAERFPLLGNGVHEFETKLFHFGKRVSSESAEKLILAADPVRPWQPAKIEHGLIYGAAYPEEQRQFPIVMFGSSGQLVGDRGVSVLGALGSGRGLSLNGWGGGWSASYRFLAVRPVLSAL